MGIVFVLMIFWLFCLIGLRLVGRLFWYRYVNRLSIVIDLIFLILFVVLTNRKVNLCDRLRLRLNRLIV